MANRLTRAVVESHVTVVPFEDIARTWALETLPRSVGNGFWAWLPAVAIYDDPTRPFTAELLIDMTADGTVGFSTVTLRSRAGRVMRAGDERLPLSLIAPAVMGKLSYPGPVERAGVFRPQTFARPPAPEDREAALRQAILATSPRRPRARAPVTEDRLQKVAEAYRKPHEGKTRRASVADALNVSKSRAGELIRLARRTRRPDSEENFLGPAPGPRRAGEAEIKAAGARAPKKRSTK